MLRRIASVYLWIAPLMIVPLWYAYHLIGLRAGIVCAAAHLFLVALGMWARGIFNWDELPTSYGLARVILTAGGGIVWAMGASGPPERSNVTLAFYNNVGLLSGLFIIFLGLAALKDELQKEKRGALAAVGLASFSLSYVTWLLECFFMWMSFRTPAAALPTNQRPEWYLALYFVYHWSASVTLGSVYLAAAAFVSAGLLTGRINRRGGLVMLFFSLLGVIFGVTRAIPFFIPAVTCVVPYFLGVILRRSADTEAV